MGKHWLVDALLLLYSWDCRLRYTLKLLLRLTFYPHFDMWYIACSILVSGDPTGPERAFLVTTISSGPSQSTYLWEKHVYPKFSICCHEFTLHSLLRPELLCLLSITWPLCWITLNPWWSILVYLLVLRVSIPIINLLRESIQLSSSNLFMLSQSNLARHINELTSYIQIDIRYWSNNLKSYIVYGINLRKPYLCLPQWSSPLEATESFISKEIWLAPPQFYEMRRLENFASLSDLHKFCLDHVLEGVERWMPITLLTADGHISLLPGKISEASMLLLVFIFNSLGYMEVLSKREDTIYSLILYTTEVLMK